MESERKIAIFEPLRIRSTRIPRKILQSVGGRRLLDICVDKLAEIKDRSGIPTFVACYEGDSEIVKAASRSGIGIIPMSMHAACSASWMAIYCGIGRLLRAAGFEWALHTHAACHPFVRPQTIIQAAERCRYATKPFVVATEERTIAWTRDVCGDSVEVVSSPFLDSRNSPSLIRPAHLGGACEVDAMFRSDGMKDAEPFVPEGVTPLELLDCDTSEELELLRIVAEGMKRRERCDAEVYCDGPLAGQSRE